MSTIGSLAVPLLWLLLLQSAMVSEARDGRVSGLLSYAYDIVPLTISCDECPDVAPTDYALGPIHATRNLTLRCSLQNPEGHNGHRTFNVDKTHWAWYEGQYQLQAHILQEYNDNDPASTTETLVTIIQNLKRSDNGRRFTCVAFRWSRASMRRTVALELDLDEVDHLSLDIYLDDVSIIGGGVVTSDLKVQIIPGQNHTLGCSLQERESPSAESRLQAPLWFEGDTLLQANLASASHSSSSAISVLHLNDFSSADARRRLTCRVVLYGKTLEKTVHLDIAQQKDPQQPVKTNSLPTAPQQHPNILPTAPQHPPSNSSSTTSAAATATEHQHQQQQSLFYWKVVAVFCSSAVVMLLMVAGCCLYSKSPGNKYIVLHS